MAHFRLHTTQSNQWASLPSQCVDSGLLVVVMLLPELSLTSRPGREAEPPLEPDFLLPGMEGTAGSVKEPLPGAGPLRSWFTFSLSAGEGEERDRNLEDLNYRQLRCRKTKALQAVIKGTETMWDKQNRQDEYGAIRASAVNERVS